MLAAAETSRSLTGAAWDAAADTPPLAAWGSCDPAFVPKDPWGNIEAETGPQLDGVEYAFTGREWDRETGLYYYRARYYDPKAGRFISEDPIGLAGGINMYAYVHGNPVNRRDPSGLFSPDTHDYLFMFGLKDYRGITETDLNVMAVASRAFDLRSQATEFSYMHSMRSPDQSPEEALRLRDEFVTNRLCAAREYARKGNRRSALILFAEAAHALQDSYSPLHMVNGVPQPWTKGAMAKSLVGHGHSPFEGWGHEDMSSADLLRSLKAMNAMRDAYDVVFPR